MKNEIIAVSSATTMTSLEIASLTGKRHDNVRADIQKMGESLSLRFQEKSVPSEGGRPALAYLLNKDETLCLVSGYDPRLRMAIIKRWSELEAQTPAIPQTYAAALLEAGRLALELEQAKPAVEFVERYVESDGLMNFRSAAKLFQRNERDLRSFLVSHGWMYRSGKSWVPYAPHLNKGHFEMKVGEANGFGYQVAYFTPRGIEALGAALAQHG